MTTATECLQLQGKGAAWRRLAHIALAALLAGCSSGGSPPSVSHVAQAAFVNGGFEDGNLGGWTSAHYLNQGITTFPPTQIANLGLVAGGADLTSAKTGATESQIPFGLTSSESLRYPRYGTWAVEENVGSSSTYGNATNASRLTQSMVTTSADVDASDGKIHVRFALAPVLQNPNPPHADNQQPYFYVELRNDTKATRIFSTFNFVNQPGVPWKTNVDATVQYTDWQLFDVAPGTAGIAIGDTVTIEAIAAGCSRGGHFGVVYLDAFGAFIPGITVAGAGPQQANDGTDITYTFVAKNGGTASDSNVTITDVLPTNTTFVSLNAPGATCTAPTVGAAGTVSCNIGTLNPSASYVFTITVHIATGTTGTIANGNYSIKGDLSSPLLGPLIVTTVTSGVVFADLAITNSNGLAAVGWGAPVSYTLVASNQGPAAVVGATISDAFPAELTGIIWTCVATGGATCAAVSGSGNINALTNLPTGGSVTYTITANIIAGSGAGQVINTAQITTPSGTTDNNTANNTAVDVDNIGTLRAVTVAKSGSGGGSIVSSPSTIACDVGCSSASGNFVDGSMVSLTATAAPGSSFAGWTGGCTGTVNPCTITVSADVSVTAIFSLPSFVTNASVFGGNGTIVCTSPTVQGLNSVCTLTPSPGYTLDSLSLDDNDVLDGVVGDTFTIIAVDATHTVLATFKKALGTLCGATGECHSNACVDGVCCNVACTGQCEACDVTGFEGICSPAIGSPHTGRTTCATDGSTCGGSCDGSLRNACAYQGAATGCRAASCNNGVETLSAVCNGEGACPTLQTEGCGFFLCAASDCKTVCAGDGDCAAVAFCSAGSCVPKTGTGTVCTANANCTSGACTDGVCCDRACDGQCEACNLVGQVGLCSAVTGAPHGARSPCLSDGTLCGGSCNGAITGSCTFPSTLLLCRGQTCTAGSETQAATCDGAGLCGPLATQTCGRFACGPLGCNTTCLTVADCAEGSVCDGGTCVGTALPGTTCKSDGFCAAGHCVDGVCCESACEGQCQACNVTGSLGTCVTVAGTPRAPRAACAGVGTTCGSVCDGVTGAICTFAAVGKVCGQASCEASLATATPTCDGNGACAPGQSKVCQAGCNGTQCAAIVDIPDAGVDAGVLKLNGGGFGCQVGGAGTNASGTLLFMLAMGLGVWVLRRKRYLAVVVVVAMVLGSSAPSLAQGFQLNRFEPAPAGQSMFTVDHPWYARSLQFAAGLTMDYAHNPLVFGRQDSNGFTVLDSVVEHQLVGHLDLAVSAFDRLNLSFSLPVTLLERGTPAGGVSPISGAQVGDPRIGLTVRLWRHADRDPFSLHIAGYLWVPVGTQSDHSGDQSTRGLFRLIAAGMAHRHLRWTFNAGVLLRSSAVLGDGVQNSRVGHELQLGGALTFVGAKERLTVGPEASFGTLIVDGKAFQRDASGLEVLLGLHYRIADTVLLGVAGGVGVLREPGTPDGRVLLRVAYAPSQRQRVWVRPVYQTPAYVCPPVVIPPPSDRDHDGFPDADDLCPDESAWPTPDPARRGCVLPPPPMPVPVTILDRDADGIPDDLDACPDRAGPAQADPKHNGCPLVEQKAGKLEILEPVFFATGKDVILVQSFAVLQAVADVLVANQGITLLVVEGHTDSRGNKDQNLSLSRHRASSVRKWLIEHAVDSGRLKAEGFGDRKSIASNQTEEGRATNRRVEFRIAEQTPTP